MQEPHIATPAVTFCTPQGSHKARQLRRIGSSRMQSIKIRVGTQEHHAQKQRYSWISDLLEEDCVQQKSCNQRGKATHNGQEQRRRDRRVGAYGVTEQRE